MAGIALAQPPAGGAAPAAPREAEWRGMEVRNAMQGVVVTNSEAAAARAGIQMGDVVNSINGAQVRTIRDFVQATQNGELRQGTVIMSRNGQRLAFELTQRPAAPTMVSPPRVQAPQMQAPQMQAPQMQAPQMQAPQMQAPQMQAPQMQAPQWAPRAQLAPQWPATSQSPQWTARTPLQPGQGL